MMPDLQASWFANTYIGLIKWWSELFGLDTPQAVTIVAAVVAGGVLLFLINILISIVLGALSGLLR